MTFLVYDLSPSFEKHLLIQKQHADNAQHAFPSGYGTTVHIALPAIEALHKAWSTRLMREKYQVLVPAMAAGLDKIEECYDRNSDADVYTFAMC